MNERKYPEWMGKMRYLIKFTSVKTISGEGVEWHEKYLTK